MASQNHASPKSKKHKPESAPRNPAPNEILDTSDPGDETQRRYRYQHAYGVILLVAAICNKNPYVAIWCEHHEDLLAERKDGFYDAYQIKTQLPNYGLWELTKEPLKASIKRFVELDQRFPGEIKEFVFVSNIGYGESTAMNKYGRSPKHFLQAIQQVASQDDLESPFDEAFEILRVYCDCRPSNLITTLKKLKLAQGPDLDSFEAVIAQEHLPQIRECSTLPAAALATLRDELIAQIYRASSLSTGNPSRHWRGLHEEDRLNPKLIAKRITIESTSEYITKNRRRLQSFLEDAKMLNEGLEEVLLLYLGKSFNDDRIAKLDQAGETDPDRSTLLRQVFVDLELKPRSGPSPTGIKKVQLTIQEEEVEQFIEVTPSEGRVLSAMSCFLKEPWPMIVIIGGPGQGKSTLGQYLAQVHRGLLLNRESELYQDIAGSKAPKRRFKPKTLRRPFRIVLKYFAQWLADGPTLDSVEAYIAEQINKGASRPGEVSAPDVQQIMRSHATLIIFDGLDEVTEPELRSRVLNRLEEFLERAALLKADIQVIATSRPTGYSDQFDPKQFWHLELQPMSVTKVRDYTHNWALAKVTIEEERRRVKDTLEECLQEEHTRLLLTTPLQVTIVLLIIKDGGRPPAQREALFQNYWTTILRREKSKAKGVIRTDESLLFNLHAYLGYLLHRKSGAENVRSLLSTEEFEEQVYKCLQANDEYSSQDALRQIAAQMLKEARDRLVLLVEPEPGLFGFELRSLQEFFAAAYLVQTADDTHQRFGRLRAIARSEYWRNVALFFAGRVVRDFRGEAVNILEQVCRPIDREQPDIRLRRGSWLALDIASDGVFATNRNLQYSALEHALAVLNTGIKSKDRQHLASALGKLSPEDHRDILSKLLKQKQVPLPLSRISVLLSLYSKSTGTQQDFMQGLEVLLSSNQRENILSAFQLGFENKVEPRWLATQLKKYWDIWVADAGAHTLWMWWRENSLYTQKILSALILEKDQIFEIMNNLPRMHFIEESNSKLSIPQNLTEQLLSFMQCASIQGYIELRYTNWEAIYDQNGKGKADNVNILVHDAQKYEKLVERFSNSSLIRVLDQLLLRVDLLPLLKFSLWNLYFTFHEPSAAKVTEFLEECRLWAENQALLEPFWEPHLIQIWPLLAFASRLQLKGDKDRVQHLLPFLNKSREIAISQQIQKSIKKKLKMLPTEEITELIFSIQCGDVNSLPELAPLAEHLGMGFNELIDLYVFFNVRGDQKVSPIMIQQIFSEIERGLGQSERIQNVIQNIAFQKWPKDQETFNQGKQLLTLLIKRIPHQPDALQLIVFIFLKLLVIDCKILELAPSLLSTLSNLKVERELAFRHWISPRVIEDIPVRHLVELSKFMKDEDKIVQQGAFALWEILIDEALNRRYAVSNKSIMSKIKSLKLDWQASLSLLKHTDSASKIRGITLLAFSEFPITEAKYRAELLNAISQAQDIEEIRAWITFLQNVLIPESKKSAWQGLLETILDRPQTYTSKILDASMERYATLIGEAGPEIRGDEVALGLPTVTNKGY